MRRASFGSIQSVGSKPRTSPPILTGTVLDIDRFDAANARFPCFQAFPQGFHPAERSDRTHSCNDDARTSIA